MQVIPNIACDNAPNFKIMCQKVTREASKLSDMLIRQENLPNPYQELLRKAGNSQQGKQPRMGENNCRSRSKEAPSSLESCLFATHAYGKTANTP